MDRITRFGYVISYKKCLLKGDVSMELMDLISFVEPGNIILIVFVWCLGLFFKKAPWFNAEWKIPFILLIVSVVFSILHASSTADGGLTSSMVIPSIIQGVIVAALAVFGNEALKQLFVKRRVDERREEERYKW